MSLQTGTSGRSRRRSLPLLFAAVSGMLLFCSGCRQRSDAAPQEVKSQEGAAPTATVSGFPRTLIDARGKHLTLSSPPKRIVSLIPSNTEVLYALGAGENVAAVTSADDTPPEVRSKPSVGNVLTASLEGIQAQNPDLVVALGSLNQQPIEALDRAGIPTLVVDPKNLEETYDSIRLLGRAVGREAKAEQVVQEMKTRIEQVKQAVGKTASRPKVLILYDLNPLYTTGPDSFINDVIRIAGGRNIVERPLPGNVISPEQVVLEQPEVIVCGKELAARVRPLPGWSESIPAVIHNRFYTGEQTLVRPTPRLAQAIEDLARYLHPELRLPQERPAPPQR